MTPFSLIDIRLIECISDVPGQPGVVKIAIEAHEPGDLQVAMNRHLEQVDREGGLVSFDAPFQRGLGWMVEGTRHE